MSDQDPALSQEGAGDGASSTVTDPQVTEGVAESSEKSGEGAPHKDQEATEAVEIVVDGEEPPSPKDAAPPWVKDLRKEHRDLKARNAELEAVLKSQGQAKQVDPGPKPTLESCDFDANAFEKKLESWHDGRKRKEAADAQASQAADDNRRAWQSRLDAYAKSKDELSKKIPDYADAEAAVQGLLDVTQQGVLLHVADNSALVVAALGQNPNLAKDLASEKDPIRFAGKIAKLEARLKTQKKTQAPPPEKPVRGTGAVSGSGDSRQNQLRDEAEKSGDYTKLHEYNREKRQQQR